MLRGIVSSHSFLLTSLAPQANPSSRQVICPPGRTTSKTYPSSRICIFSSILNCSWANQKNSIIMGWKYRSRELLKTTLFCLWKNNQKGGWLFMKFLRSSIQACSSCINLLFQKQCINILLPPLLQRISQSPGQDQKNSNELCDDYHLSPSGLTSSIHPSIFQ